MALTSRGYRTWLSLAVCDLDFPGLAVKPIMVFRLSVPVSFCVRPIDVVPKMVSSGVMDGKKCQL
jgi:hypothetical protein